MVVELGEEDVISEVEDGECGGKRVMWMTEDDDGDGAVEVAPGLIELSGNYSQHMSNMKNGAVEWYSPHPSTKLEKAHLTPAIKPGPTKTPPGPQLTRKDRPKASPASIYAPSAPSAED